MYKIDFNFLSAIARESPLYQNKWNSEGKLPKRKRIFGAYYQNFCKENDLPSRFSQSYVNELVMVAAKEVWFFTAITSILFYYYRTVAKLRVLGSPHSNFSNIRTELKNIYGGVPPYI